MAAPTVVSYEDFTGQGVIGPGSTATLGSVPGALTKRRFGPRPSVGDPGWSVVVNLTGAANSYNRRNPDNSTNGLNLDNTGANAGVMYGVQHWVYFGEFTSQGASNDTLCWALHENFNNFGEIGISRIGGVDQLAYQAGLKGIYSYTAPGTPVPISALLGKWVQFRITFQKVNTSQAYNMSLSYRIAGQAAFTELYLTSTPGSQGGSVPAGATQGGFWTGYFCRGGNTFRGRFGRVEYFTLAAWADRLDPTTMLDPLVSSTAPYDLYFDPLNGSDANDGSSAAQAWKTMGKLFTESSLGFFLSVAASQTWEFIPGVLSIDQGLPYYIRSRLVGAGYVTTAGNVITPLFGYVDQSLDADVLWALYRGGLTRSAGNQRILVVADGGVVKRVTLKTTKVFTDNIACNGLRIDTDTGQRADLSYALLLAGSDWALVGGETAVYRTAVAAPNCQLWRDNIELAKPAGASYAAVATALKATPDSYYCDGTWIYYYHPTIDPRTAPNVFERTQFSYDGAVGFDFKSAGVEWRNVNVTKTATISAADNSNGNGSYAMQIQGGGFNVVRDCAFTRWSKHPDGCSVFASPALPGRTCMFNVDVGPCRQGISNSAMTAYTDGAFTTHQFLADGVRFPVGYIPVGSDGTGITTTNFSGPAITCHQGGTATWSKLFFLGCNMIAGAYDIQNPAQLATEYTTIGIAGGANNASTYKACVFDRWTANFAGVLTDCLLNYRVMPDNGSDSYRINSTNTQVWTRCTFNASANPQAANSPLVYFWTGVLTLNGRDNLLALPPATAVTFSDASSAQLVLGLTNTRIVAADPSKAMVTGTTMAAHATASGGASYSNYTAAGVNTSTLRLTAGSPLIGAATPAANTPDVTGTLFAARNDVGAYEFQNAGRPFSNSILLAVGVIKGS